MAYFAVKNLHLSQVMSSLLGMTLLEDIYACNSLVYIHVFVFTFVT